MLSQFSIFSLAGLSFAGPRDGAIDDLVAFDDDVDMVQDGAASDDNLDEYFEALPAVMPIFDPVDLFGDFDEEDGNLDAPNPHILLYIQ